MEPRHVAHGVVGAAEVASLRDLVAPCLGGDRARERAVRAEDGRTVLFTSDSELILRRAESRGPVADRVCGSALALLASEGDGGCTYISLVAALLDSVSRIVACRRDRVRACRGLAICRQHMLPRVLLRLPPPAGNGLPSLLHASSGSAQEFAPALGASAALAVAGKIHREDAQRIGALAADWVRATAELQGQGGAQEPARWRRWCSAAQAAREAMPTVHVPGRSLTFSHVLRRDYVLSREPMNLPRHANRVCLPSGRLRVLLLRGPLGLEALESQTEMEAASAQEAANMIGARQRAASEAAARIASLGVAVLVCTRAVPDAAASEGARRGLVVLQLVEEEEVEQLCALSGAVAADSACEGDLRRAVACECSELRLVGVGERRGCSLKDVVRPTSAARGGGGGRGCCVPQLVLGGDVVETIRSTESLLRRALAACASLLAALGRGDPSLCAGGGATEAALADGMREECAAMYGREDLMAACSDRGVPPLALARVACCVEDALREVAARIRSPGGGVAVQGGHSSGVNVVQHWGDSEQGWLLQQRSSQPHSAALHLGQGSAHPAQVPAMPQPGRGGVRPIPLSAVEQAAAQRVETGSWADLRRRGHAALLSPNALSLRDASPAGSAAEGGAACLAQPRVAGLCMALETVEALARVDSVAPAMGR